MISEERLEKSLKYLAETDMIQRLNLSQLKNNFTMRQKTITKQHVSYMMLKSSRLL
jgi:hypothetical protein